MTTDYAGLLAAVTQAHALPKGPETVDAWTDAHNAVIDAARRDLAALGDAVVTLAAELSAHDSQDIRAAGRSS